MLWQFGIVIGAVFLLCVGAAIASSHVAEPKKKSEFDGQDDWD